MSDLSLLFGFLGLLTGWLGILLMDETKRKWLKILYAILPTAILVGIVVLLFSFGVLS